MFLFITVLKVVFPIFFLGSIGFIWAKLNIDYPIKFVTQLFMNVSLPCLVFISLTKTEIESSVLNSIIYSTIMSYFTLIFACYIIVKIIKIDIPTFLPPMVFGNTGNLGLPLSFFAFGQVGLSYAIIIFSIMVIFSFTYGIWIVSGKTNFIKVIKEPIVLSTILGGIALFLKLEIPDFLSNSLELTGQIAIPLMLITLGYSVAKLTFNNLNQSLFLVIYRTLICLFVAIAFSYAFNLSKVPSAILILQLTTPIAVTSYLLSEKYNRNPNEVAGLVVVSTFFSIFYIPIILSFLI